LDYCIDVEVGLLGYPDSFNFQFKQVTFKDCYLTGDYRSCHLNFFGAFLNFDILCTDHYMYLRCSDFSIRTVL